MCLRPGKTKTQKFEIFVTVIPKRKNSLFKTAENEFQKTNANKKQYNNISRVW